MTPDAPVVARRLRRTVPVAVLALVLAQVTLVNLLPTPGAVPDLATVAVLALGLAHGPVVGALAGALAGLVLDVIPPAAGPLGAWMLVLTLAGAAVGHLADTRRPGPFLSMAVVGLGSAIVVLGRAGVLWFAGAPADTAVVASAFVASLWALFLSPLALMVVTPRPRAVPRADRARPAAPEAPTRLRSEGPR